MRAYIHKQSQSYLQAIFYNQLQGSTPKPVIMCTDAHRTLNVITVVEIYTRNTAVQS